MIDYITTNKEFLPSMINLWGLAWEVFPGFTLNWLTILAKFYFSCDTYPPYIMSVAGSVIKCTLSFYYYNVYCTHNLRATNKNYLSHLILWCIRCNSCNHSTFDKTCSCISFIHIRHALSTGRFRIQRMAKVIIKKGINERKRDPTSFEETKN